MKRICKNQAYEQQSRKPIGFEARLFDRMTIKKCFLSEQPLTWSFFQSLNPDKFDIATK
jgi:hypothetical protein